MIVNTGFNEQVLQKGDRTTEKGKIILITDGEENVPPNITDVTPQLIKAKVIVYGLAFGNQASMKIEDLCYETGGSSWLYNSNNVTQSLDSMLGEIFQNCGPLESRPMIVSLSVALISGIYEYCYLKKPQITTSSSVLAVKITFTHYFSSRKTVPLFYCSIIEKNVNLLLSSVTLGAA